MNKKKKIISIGVLVIALVVISSIFAGVNNNKEYNKYLSSYEQNFEEENYEVALSSLNGANELKSVDNYDEKENKCEILKISLSDYNNGIEYLNQKKYKLASESFQKVSIEDDERYNIAQEKLLECKNLYRNEIIETSKTLSASGDYDKAVSVLDSIESTEQVKALTTEYKDLKNKQEEAKKQDELKKQQEIVRQQQEAQLQAQQAQQTQQTQQTQQAEQEKIVQAETQNKSSTVYITKTGAKYHRDGCRYLSKSKISISLPNAKSSYSPCSVCNPPQ